jgi:hypothetical protein
MFLGQKPVQTGLTRFFLFCSVLARFFSGLALFFAGLARFFASLARFFRFGFGLVWFSRF